MRLLVLGVAVVLAGCSSAAPKSGGCKPCERDMDCFGGETCRRFVCVVDGEDPSHCANARTATSASSGATTGSSASASSGAASTGGQGGSSGASTAAASTASGSTTAASSTATGSAGGSTGGGAAPDVLGLADDPDWHQSKTWALACSAGPCTYRYRIDAVAGGGFGAESYQAISQVTANADLANPDTPTGAHYLHVQARGPGGEGPVVAVRFQIDVTPPSAPTGVASNQPASISASNPGVSATWAASTDAESGVVGYQVALVGADDGVVARGWVDLASGASLPRINGLAEGDYAVAVRARDAAGNLSAPGLSATFTLAYQGGDSYSDDPNVGVRTGQPSLGDGLIAVPTFHSLGLYWAAAPGGGASNAASVQFRPAGASAWRAGLPLWFDARNSEYRGSLVLLQPGTAYEVQVTLASGASASVTARTWAEQFPIARTITAPPGTSSAPLQVTESGSPGGYVLYTADPAGSTIDQGFAHGSYQNCVDVRASYVIVRGLTLRNCQAAGVEIHAGAHDVVVEGNDISGFGYGPGGEVQGPTDQIVPGQYEQGGVYCQARPGQGAKPYRIVVQRNRIHDPRYGSIHWNYAHPNSANGIFFGHCGGNNVFRYNDLWGSIGHYYGDGIGGSDNFTYEGFPAADSDIYGNRVADCYDDAIEADGANRNVRIWGNYLHHDFNAISQAANSVGPAYTWRNIVNETGGMANPVTRTPDTEDRAELLKVGSNDTGLDNGGRMYVFHNLTLQPPAPAGSGLTLPMGVGGGITHAAGPAYQVVSRNNVLWIWKSWWESLALDSSAGPVDADYDLYNGALTGAGPETHGLTGEPTFHASLDPQLYDASLPASSGQYQAGTVYLAGADPSAAGDFSLAPGSPGVGAGEPLPNFNDAYASPDLGAHQSGTSPMQFGVDAYPSGFPADY